MRLSVHNHGLRDIPSLRVSGLMGLQSFHQSCPYLEGLSGAQLGNRQHRHDQHSITSAKLAIPATTKKICAMPRGQDISVMLLQKVLKNDEPFCYQATHFEGVVGREQSKRENKTAKKSCWVAAARWNTQSLASRCWIFGIPNSSMRSTA